MRRASAVPHVYEKTMDGNRLSRKLADVQQRLGDLQRRIEEDPERGVEGLPKAFEQLHAKMEELRIAALDPDRHNVRRDTEECYRAIARNGRDLITESDTERRRTEEALRENERFLENAFDAIRDGISVLDSELNIVRVNSWVERMYVHEMPVAGKKCYAVYQRRDSPCPWCPILETLKTGRTRSAVVPYPCQERPTGWIDLSVFPLKDDDGRILGVIEYVKDVTDRKRAEDLARERQAELAHVLRLGTMGEMASGFAHELNQPLTAITAYASGCLNRLRSGAGHTDELVSAMEAISAQAQRAGEVIRRLGSFVRKRNPKRTTVNINHLVQEVLQFVEPDARNHGIAMEVSLSEGLTPVLADDIQIQQVLVNLLRNGMEAMVDVEPGERLLTIRTAAVEGDHVEVTIRDAGHGVSEEVRKQLFTPFFTTKPQGMGMGLSISRTIIRAHGGRLWATPNPDRGATFRFTLPHTSGADHRAD